MPVDDSEITQWEKDEYAEAFHVYCIFQALKLHFQKPNFSYAEYGPMENYKFETFYKNTARRKQFAKFARRFNHQQDERIELYIIAALIKNPKAYVPNMMTKQAQSDYEELVKLYENFTHNFGVEFEDVLIPRLRELDMKFMDYLKTPMEQIGGVPYFMQDVMSKKYPSWFVVGMDFITGFGNMYKQFPNPFWESELYLIKKIGELVPARDYNGMREKVKELCRSYHLL